MDQQLTKAERLRLKVQLQQILNEGHREYVFPFRLLWHDGSAFEQEPPVRVAFSVPKRIFKRAVDRNRIKRLMRECYRRHKNLIYPSLIKEKRQIGLFIIYTASEMITYGKMEKQMKKALTKLQEAWNEAYR